MDARMMRISRRKTAMLHAGVMVWDLPTRLTHWGLVLSVVAAWIFAEIRWLDYHRLAGFIVLTLLLFRTYWGLVGTQTARLRNFLSKPSEAWAYGRTLLSRQQQFHLGHNPLGGLSALLMLSMVFVQVFLGLLSVDVDGIESGPLTGLVSFDLGRKLARLHSNLFNWLLAAIALHVTAIVFYLICKRTNLIWPMVTGRKAASIGAQQAVRPASIWLAAVGLFGSAAIVFGIANWPPFR